MFFDQNDLFLLAERKNEVDQLEDNIKYLDVEINKMAVEYNALMNNSEVLEQYARETFKMKHTQEDVYVIEK
jgi:cell division protein FtsL